MSTPPGDLWAVGVRLCLASSRWNTSMACPDTDIRVSFVASSRIVRAPDYSPVHSNSPCGTKGSNFFHRLTNTSTSIAA